MEMIAIMIRKWDCNENGKYTNPPERIIKKQILTLHRKLKKGDKVFTEYSIEKNKDGKGNHIHLILHFKDKENLYQQLSRYIGNGEWKKREVGMNVFDECNGRFGLIHTEPIEDEWKYRRYINKEQLTTTLI